MELFEIGVFLTLLALGFFVGRVIEARHYASIRSRERALQDVLAFAARFPPDRVTAQHAFLVTGTVVVSADYFKTFVAGLRNLIGGRFRSYETLMERARREALLRLKSEARRRGSKLVVCVRFETTSLSSGYAPSMEVFAYGTALIPRKPGEAELPDKPKMSRLLGEGTVRYAPAAPEFTLSPESGRGSERHTR